MEQPQPELNDNQKLVHELYSLASQAAANAQVHQQALAIAQRLNELMADEAKEQEMDKGQSADNGRVVTRLSALLFNFIMKKSKTVIAGIATILSAAGGYLSGELELSAALNLTVTAVLAIFLRAGVQKAIPKDE